MLPSNYTPAKNIVRLAPPTDIHLVPDEDGDALTWNAANSNADHFEVYWNDEPETAVNATELGDIGKYITTGSRGLFMRAVANYEDKATGTYFITSKPSATVTFVKLEPVTFNNELVKGNKFVWNAPGNVDGTSIQYRVYQNNGIALDGTHTGDMIGGPKMTVKLGEGAAIKIKDSSVICSRSVINRMTELSEKHGIKYQYEVLTAGGTDTSSMQTACAGAFTGCISIPTRYIHTPVETVDMADVTACVNLLAAIIKEGF